MVTSGTFLAKEMACQHLSVRDQKNEIVIPSEDFFRENGESSFIAAKEQEDMFCA